MSADYIHGSSDEREVARLEKQARFAGGFILERFDAAPGMRVLDLATGVGAMAGELLRRYPGIELTGVELRASQLEHARANHPGATYVQADAAHLPFPDGHFDRIHCSWLLEHVRDPLPILREALRVLKPGGLCQFIEVDNASFSIHPPDSDVSWLMGALNEAQAKSGGDPFLGQKLGALFGEAGFKDVETWDAPLDADQTRPEFLQGCIDEFAEIFESVDEALGHEAVPRIERAARALRALTQNPEARFYYRSVIATGRR